MPLPRRFYDRDTLLVARELLGAHLVRGKRIGRIVETEAYLGPAGDRAAHTFRGPTPRNAVMFGPPGHAYVFFVYGMHFCFNVVTQPGCAVLIRAIEPVEKIDGRTCGPALLCRALGITRELNGVDLCGKNLFLKRGTPPSRIKTTPRIGVDYAGAWAKKPWRFFDGESECVSR